MSEPIQTTTSFTLPIGVEIEGITCTEITMRKVKNKDILAIQKDQDIKVLASEKMDINSGNPIASMKMNSSAILMFTLLFCKVVTKIGDFTEMKKAIFEEMWQEDMQEMIMQYTKLNGVKLTDEDKKAAGIPLKE